MKGTILHIDSSAQTGIITGENQQRYEFTFADLKSPSITPRVGLSVDFEINGKQAINIYQNASHTEFKATKKLIAGLLALFLGAFGIHKFYLGYTKQGIIHAVIFIFGFILLGLPSMLIALIAFIEAILYLSKSDTEFERVYITGRKPWF